MNKVILMGRLVRDPEVRYSQSGDNMAIARFTLAVDRRVRRQEASEQTADFIPCVAFGKLGEFAEKYLHQGTKVAVVGRIQTGSYTNKDGQKVYTTDVVLDDIEFAESKNANGGNYSEGGSNNSTSGSNSSGGGNGFVNISDAMIDELPFN